MEKLESDNQPTSQPGGVQPSDNVEASRPIHLMSKATGNLAPTTTQPTAQSVSTSAEERERRLAEQRAIAALRLQRKQRLSLMVNKRKTNLAYLKKVHLGNCYWLNVALFSPEEINKYIATMIPKSRALNFFYFGLSISRLLSLPPGISTVRACGQLLEEWEYFMSGAAMQSVKYFTSKTSPCVYPQTVTVDTYQELSRPTLYRFNNTVVYEYLQVPHIAFDMDYREVLLSLCDALTNLYQKLLHEESYNNQVVYETILKFDTRMKHHIINLIAKELTELANVKVRNQTTKLRSLMSV